MSRPMVKIQADGIPDDELIAYARDTYGPMGQALADRFEEALILADRAQTLADARQDRLIDIAERFGTALEELQTLINKED